MPAAEPKVYEGFMSGQGDDRIPRREALALGGKALTVLAVAGCGGKIEGLKDVPTDDGVLRLGFEQHPRLRLAGGSAIVRADGRGKPILVREVGGEYLALSLKCTHLGCTVKVDESAQVLACPCHGSRFSLVGEVEHGPADEPLERFPTSVEGEFVLVSVG